MADKTLTEHTAAGALSGTDKMYIVQGVNGRKTTLADLSAYFLSGIPTGGVNIAGPLDGSTNPNYPAADKGDGYLVTVAGKVGGAAGEDVEVGDLVVAYADNAGGDEATVGSSWFVLNRNLTGDGGAAIEVLDEGVSQTPLLLSLNFTGDGVTATDDGLGNVEVAVSGGSGLAVEQLAIALSNETDALVAGTSVVTIHAAYDFEISDAFLGLSGTASAGVTTADANLNGVSIFTTPPSVAAGDDFSFDAGSTDAALTATTIAVSKGDKLTFDLDAVGTDAVGAKLYLVINVTGGSDVYAPTLLEPVEVAGTTHSPGVNDKYSSYKLTSASDIIVTLPKEATTPVPVGARIRYLIDGAGNATFVAEDGTVTVKSRDGADTSAGQYAVVEVYKSALNEYYLLGDLV